MRLYCASTIPLPPPHHQGQSVTQQHPHHSRLLLELTRIPSAPLSSRLVILQRALVTPARPGP
ncbi:hypothetical protein CBOM_07916 [Ceraceosorus bombacis]|uniref:Uncharacterized protein n=1 Tax=Ceraceosorus bombacis TaxID=401625 RepID=A0A0N7LB91_9BASI|nr:hypothetical protein CBOM_07916 [Ceraceosorus bombacis]